MLHEKVTRITYTNHTYSCIPPAVNHCIPRKPLHAPVHAWTLVYCVPQWTLCLFNSMLIRYSTSFQALTKWRDITHMPTRAFQKKNRGQEIPFSFFLTCLLYMYSCKGNVAFLIIVLSVNFRLLSMWLPWQTRCLWWNCLNCNLVWSSLHSFACVLTPCLLM